MIATSYGPEQWAVAIGILLAALGGLITTIWNLKQGKSNAAKIDNVHTLVNDRSEKQDARIDQLGKALTGAGVDVPDRPNPEQGTA